jgi:DNA primase
MSDQFLLWSKNGQKLDDVYVFPLTTTTGEIRGVQFRHVARERSGYSDFLLDQREPCLFGLHQAAEAIWDSRSVYLVEGAFDLLPVQRAAPFVVATMTAYVNSPVARVLRRLVRRVWLGYDMDEPGRKGCEIFQKKHGRDFEVYVVEYPKVNGKQMKDPGKLWEVWGDAQIIPFICSTIERENPFL